LYLSGFFGDVTEPLEIIKEYLENQGYTACVCNSLENETSILPLKSAAIRAGFGWQGKNSLLVSKRFGTFLALGGIITNAEIESNEMTEPNRCGSCNKCREACPLSALDQPFVLDKRKCLSFLLQQDQLPEEAKAVMENRVGDCEICQDTCPWNKKHIEDPLRTEPTLSFQERIGYWEKVFHLPELIEIPEAEYKRILGPLKTNIPYTVFIRNVRIALDTAKGMPSEHHSGIRKKGRGIRNRQTLI
jgi:epoxyqueuosine reductase